jgi:hemerythrin superfamily protein
MSHCAVRNAGGDVLGAWIEVVANPTPANPAATISPSATWATTSLNAASGVATSWPPAWPRWRPGRVGLRLSGPDGNVGAGTPIAANQAKPRSRRAAFKPELPMKPASSMALDDDEVSDEDVDAIELLTADHEDLSQLFAAYEELVSDGAGSEERAAVARQICRALTAHSMVEEGIFYPAVREVIDDDERIDVAVSEHTQAKVLIARLRALSASNDRFDGTVQLLQDAIEHHVQDEEGELFPLVQETQLDLLALGERMRQRKEEVRAELEADDGAD